MPHGPRLAPGPSGGTAPRPPPRPPPPPAATSGSARSCSLLRIGSGRCATAAACGRRATAAATAATDEVHVRAIAARLERDRRHVRHRRHVEHVRFGIPGRALPERRALCGGNLQRAAQAAVAGDDRRRIERADLVLLQHRARFGVELGSEVDQIRFGHPLAIVGSGFRRMRLRRRIPFARHRAGFDLPFFDRPHRRAVTRSKANR